MCTCCRIRSSWNSSATKTTRMWSICRGSDDQWHHACSYVPGEIMRTNSTITMTLLLALTALAGDHSSLNGTWKLVPAKSDFAGQAVVQTGTVTINDRKGITVVSRSFVYAGATETFFYSDSTGNSQNSTTVHTGKNLKTKTKWDD